MGEQGFDLPNDDWIGTKEAAALYNRMLTAVRHEPVTAHTLRNWATKDDPRLSDVEHFRWADRWVFIRSDLIASLEKRAREILGAMAEERAKGNL